jgi:hypothetical protein
VTGLSRRRRLAPLPYRGEPALASVLKALDFGWVAYTLIGYCVQ